MNSIAKHTRAPWRSQGWVPTWAYIPVHDADHNLVASLYPNEHRGYSRDQVEANARLIAAAPELLAALEAQMSATILLLSKYEYSQQEIEDCTSQARAAIAAATGAS